MSGLSGGAEEFLYYCLMNNIDRMLSGRLELKQPSTDVAPSVTRRPSLIQTLPRHPSPSIHPSSLLLARLPLLKEPPMKLALYESQRNSLCPSISLVTRGLMRWFNTSRTDGPRATSTKEEAKENTTKSQKTKK